MSKSTFCPLHGPVSFQQRVVLGWNGNKVGKALGFDRGTNHPGFAGFMSLCLDYFWIYLDFQNLSGIFLEAYFGFVWVTTTGTSFSCVACPSFRKICSRNYWMLICSKGKMNTIHFPFAVKFHDNFAFS